MLKRFLFLITLTIIPMGSFLNAKVITLDDFIKSYLNSSKNLKVAFQDTEKAKAGIKKASAIDDITTKLNGGYTYQKMVNVAGSVNYDHTGTYGVGLSAQKIFSDTGTRVSASHIINFIQAVDGKTTSIPSITVADSSYYTPIFNFAVTQPILKNFLGIIDRFPYQFALIQQQIQKAQFEEIIENEMINGISSYLNWIYLIQQKRILKENIQQNIVVLRDTEARVRAGIAELSDLEVARESVIQFQNSLIEVDNAYNDALLKLKKAMDIQDEDLPDEKVLEKVFDFKTKQIETVRVMQVLDLTKKQLNLNLDAKKSAMKPDLNLIASLQMLGKDKAYSASYGDSRVWQYFLGFEFILPIFNSGARGDYDDATADYLKLIETIIDTEKDLKISEKSLKNSIESYKKLVEEQKKYIQSLDKKYRDQNKQYKQGILSLTELTRTAIDLANAKLALTSYIVKYHSYYYQYLGLVDDILTTYGSSIPSGYPVIVNKKEVLPEKKSELQKETNEAK